MTSAKQLIASGWKYLDLHCYISFITLRKLPIGAKPTICWFKKKQQWMWFLAHYKRQKGFLKIQIPAPSTTTVQSPSLKKIVECLKKTKSRLWNSIDLLLLKKITRSIAFYFLCRSEISSKTLNELPWCFCQTFMFQRDLLPMCLLSLLLKIWAQGFINTIEQTVILTVSWLWFLFHQQVKLCLSDTLVYHWIPANPLTFLSASAVIGV